MDFLGFLRDLFGGGQKPTAPPEQLPSNPRQADYQEARAAAPAAPVNLQAGPVSSLSFQTAPTPPPAPAPAAPNTGPWRPINFAPPPANAPAPPSLQAPPAEGFNVANWQKEVAQKQEADQVAEKQHNYFGNEDKYNKQEMSVDAYLTLSPQQRAAVDANTALVAAAEQDIASWAKQQVAGKPIDDKKYLSQVKDAFGDKGGSDTYAPRTMAVLEDLGLNLQGKDLDQYLNYSALVTADDLKGLVPGATGTEPRQQNATAFAEAASSRLSETLATGQNLLDSLRTGSDSGSQLFGKPAAAGPPVGFANGARDADLAQAFDILAQTRSQKDLTPETVGGLYAELQQKHGVTPNDVAQYFEKRLEANEYLNATADQPVSLGGVNSSLEYLAPKDFRAKFLTRGK